MVDTKDESMTISITICIIRNYEATTEAHQWRACQDFVRLKIARNRRRDLTVCLLATSDTRHLSLPVNTVNMRVVEIVIDGFKSYAVRTVISGWDESFNSITGLNGSGKSNILDAICFVLGITSMSTVRAQNIQAS